MVEANVLPRGPRVAALAQTAAWLLRPWELMDRCAARYGDMFTLRLAGETPWVMVSDPAVIKEVFTGPPEVLHAGQANRMLLPVVGANSVLVLDGAAHAQQRRLLTAPFRGNQLAAFTDTMNAVIHSEIARWPRGIPLQLHRRMQTMTLEVILRAVFGLQDSTRLNRLRSTLTQATMTATAKLGQLLMMAGPNEARDALIRRHFREIDRLIYAEIGKRRHEKDLDERSDVLSRLLQCRYEDGRPMSDVEIRDELMTLLTAGHDTTAAALAWAVERLAHEPQYQKRLHAELQEGKDEFLDAVIKETLRLRAVFSMVARQLMAPLTIGGARLPAGVTIVPSIYLLHRRADLYSEPTQFRPERFLAQEVSTYTWIPFGGGVRRCLGAAFAEHEMRIVLRALFAASTVHAAGRRAEKASRRGIIHVPQHGATVVLS